MLRKSQQGMSMGGVMLLAPLVGVFVLMIIKLVPIYMENGAVKSVLSGMSTEINENYANANAIKATMFKRLGINNVKAVEYEDVTVEREGPFYNIAVDYEVRVPLFYNLAIVASFSNKGQVPAF